MKHETGKLSLQASPDVSLTKRGRSNQQMGRPATKCPTALTPPRTMAGLCACGLLPG